MVRQNTTLVVALALVIHKGQNTLKKLAVKVSDCVYAENCEDSIPAHSNHTCSSGRSR